MKVEDLDVSKIQVVVCNRINKRKNNCCTYLGFIDKSRAGKAGHYCPYCKVTYLHTVYEDGRIECDVVEGVIPSLTIPVEVAPSYVYESNSKSDRPAS